MKREHLAIVLTVLAVASLVAALFGHAEGDTTKIWVGFIGAAVLGSAAYVASRK